MLHGVAGRLVLDDPRGALHLCGRSDGRVRLGQDVQVLARPDLRAHQLEHRARPLQGTRVEPGLREQLVAPAEQQVSEEDRGGGAEVGGGSMPARVMVPRGEAAMHGRLPATGVRAVDQIIVNQRRGLEELECGSRRDDRILVGGARGPVTTAAHVTGRRSPAPVAERRPEPLPAAE